MTKSVLVFLFRKNQILLGRKKTGHGFGKWNGFGGHIEEGETSEQAAVRELFEESGITVESNNLSKVAELEYKEKEEWQVEVFLGSTKEEPIPSEEMDPKWFDVNSIPWEGMWPNDKLWLEKVLRREKFKAVFWHDEVGKLLKYEFADLLV